MKKKFDTMTWIRQVRESLHKKQQTLTDEQKLESTKIDAERFRTSRPAEKTSRPTG